MKILVSSVFASCNASTISEERKKTDDFGAATSVSVILSSLHRSSSVGFTLTAAGHMGQMLGLAQRCCV